MCETVGPRTSDSRSSRRSRRAAISSRSSSVAPSRTSSACWSSRRSRSISDPPRRCTSPRHSNAARTSSSLLATQRLWTHHANSCASNRPGFLQTGNGNRGLEGDDDHERSPDRTCLTHRERAIDIQKPKDTERALSPTQRLASRRTSTPITQPASEQNARLGVQFDERRNREREERVGGPFS